MSKLDKTLNQFDIGKEVDGEMIEASSELKQEFKALMQELILATDKSPTGKESSHDLAELSGRKDAIIEMCQKVGEL